MKNYKYLNLIAGLFTATLVLTNILNTKIFAFLGFTFPAGIVTFPLSFVAADALTEVYGYRVTRQVIWSGFAALMLMVVAVVGTIHLPPASFWQLQNSFEAILNQVPRIVVASVLAYWSGEFLNSYVVARSKVRTEGRGMWLRFITSTMAGQAVDTVVFMSIAFLGVYQASQMITLFISSWVFKVLWELVALPVSVPFVKWLKAAENEDYFDRDTNFTPFSISLYEKKRRA
jgi:queuosine precursor transporter